jgi:SAM-dependent methyltransferase
MDTHQHTASLAEKDSTGEKSSAEEGLASFNTVKYWNDFYDPEQGGDCDEFDWYSTEEWLPQCVEGITASRPHLARRPLRLLDVGVGTCPLIFELARGGGARARWRELVGIDFVESAMDAMAARAAEEFGGGNGGGGDCGDGEVSAAPIMRFLAADAREMSSVLAARSEEGSLSLASSSSSSSFSFSSSLPQLFDVVFDKGCMDCFVSGDGAGDLVRYLSEVAAVLSPDGVALFVSVNGADVAEVLRSGGTCLREDSHCIQPATGNASCAARAKWLETKNQQQQQSGEPAGREAPTLLVLDSIHAFEQKHCYVCRRAPSFPAVIGSAGLAATTSGSDAAKGGGGEDEESLRIGAGDANGGVLIYCGHCGRSWTYPDFPPECPQCANKLQRFALS